MTQVTCMSEKTKDALQKVTEQLIQFKDTLVELNHADEDEIQEMKDTLYQNRTYQRAVEELFDFIKMTKKPTEGFRIG